MLNHRVFNIFDPFGRRGNVSAHSCSDVGVGLCELASGPHIAVSEEEFGAFDAVADYGRLHCHLQEFV